MLTYEQIDELVYRYMDGGFGCPSREYGAARMLAYAMLDAAGIELEHRTVEPVPDA